MPALDLNSLRTPNSVTIFAQPPGLGFVALLLSNVGIPLPGRARLDLAETEDVRRTWTITRNPVERVIAQNRIREPDTLTLTGMLSAHPLISLVAGVGIARLDKRELNKLRGILAGTQCFIVTPVRSYSGMACTELQERYDETTGKGVNVTMAFSEILIARPGLVQSTLDLDTLGMGAGTTADMGPQTAASFPDPGGLG